MLRGASADASAALGDALRAMGVDDAGAVGNDLFAVADLLRQEPALRRVATDASVEGPAKSALVRGLLEGKVGAKALDLVSDAVSRRWTATRDLADVLEHLGVVAVVRSAGEPKQLSDELFSVNTLIANNGDLRNALADPARSTAEKRGLLADLFKGSVLPATLRLVEQAVAGSHRTVSAAIESYEKTAADVYGESVATVRTALPLTETDLSRLAAALSDQYGRPVHLNVIIDPTLVGGLRVEIGDDVIDGSVSARLDDARRRLAG